MRKFILFFLSFFCSLCIYSQTEIKLSEISNHVGDTVSLTGTIMDSRYLFTSQGSPTFLNVGAKYPNDSLTLVVWGDDRSKFNGEPEKIYINKKVKISGKVVLYKGKPEIVLYSSEQIKVLSN